MKKPVVLLGHVAQAGTMWTVFLAVHLKSRQAGHFSKGELSWGRFEVSTRLDLTFVSQAWFCQHVHLCSKRGFSDDYVTRVTHWEKTSTEKFKQKPFLNSFTESNLYCRVQPAISFCRILQGRRAIQFCFWLEVLTRCLPLCLRPQRLQDTAPQSRRLRQAVQAESPHRSGTDNILKLISRKRPREALYIPLAWLRTAGNDLYWSVAPNGWHSCRASMWTCQL